MFWFYLIADEPHCIKSGSWQASQWSVLYFTALMTKTCVWSKIAAEAFSTYSPLLFL